MSKELATHETFNVTNLTLDQKLYDLNQNIGYLILTKKQDEEILVEVKVFRVKPTVLEGRPKVDFDVKKAITLRLNDELSYIEIAERLQTSIANIRRKLPKEVIKATKHLYSVKRARKKEARIRREIRGETT